MHRRQEGEGEGEGAPPFVRTKLTTHHLAVVDAPSAGPDVEEQELCCTDTLGKSRVGVRHRVRHRHGSDTPPTRVDEVSEY